MSARPPRAGPRGARAPRPPRAALPPRAAAPPRRRAPAPLPDVDAAAALAHDLHAPGAVELAARALQLRELCLEVL
jgi:hypothetical protein